MTKYFIECHKNTITKYDFTTWLGPFLNVYVKCMNMKSILLNMQWYFLFTAAVVSNVSNKNIRLGLKAGIAKSAAGFDPVESMMLSSLPILHLHSIQNHTKADLREYEIEIQHQILLWKLYFLFHSNITLSWGCVNNVTLWPQIWICIHFLASLKLLFSLLLRELGEWMYDVCLTFH